MRKLIGSVIAVSMLAAPAYAETQKKRDNQPSAQQSAAQQQAPTLPPDVKEKIAGTFDRFEEAWNQHDPKMMSNQFAVDGRVVNPMGRQAVGQQQLESFFRDEHQKALKDSRAEFTMESGRLLRPDLALADLSMKIEGMKSPSGESLPTQPMHVVALLTRQDDRWVVLDARAYQFLESPPAGVGGAGEQEGL